LIGLKLEQFQDKNNRTHLNEILESSSLSSTSIIWLVRIAVGNNSRFIDEA
jgi:hypothetical protein